MLKRCKASCTVLAPDYGRTCTLGEVLDLSVRLPRGGTLADVVRPEWFEAVEAEPEPSPRARRRVPAELASTTDEPGDPAKE